VSIVSLKQFVEVVTGLLKTWRTDTLWFRGLERATYALAPGTYRRKNLYDDEAEDERRYEFKRRAVQFPLERPPSSEWEWYFLMQHYGSPTRLLDWSEGALIGLYFAVRSHKRRRAAAVWVLEPSWLQKEVVKRCHFLPPRKDPLYKFVFEYMPDPDDDRTKWIRVYLPETFSKKALPRFPAPLRPPQIHRRIAAQLSAFTIHGSHQRGLEQVALLAKSPQLLKIRIPGRYIATIREDLETCGIVETTVFPELEGLGRELQES
jgi:hypothetical protein